jgi:hypothetical protein
MTPREQVLYIPFTFQPQRKEEEFMPEKERATIFEIPSNILSFSPPPSAPYQPLVNGRLEMLRINATVGVVAHTFEFREFGGPDHLLPGRPLSQSIPINIPPGAGWFVMLRGFGHSFMTNDPPNQLTERPLGEMVAQAGVDVGAGTLVCNVRLTDSNADDPIKIVVDVVVVFIN